jgi:hypothetical protein
MFEMKEVERPAPVLVAALNHDFDGPTDAAVGFDSCIPQVIESAQGVVVPKCWEREAQPALVDDFATSIWNEERRLFGASQFQPPSWSCSPRS